MPKKKPPAPPPAIKRLIGVPEIMAALSLSEREVWQMLSDGTLASVKLGRRRLVRVEELDRFVDSLSASA